MLFAATVSIASFERVMPDLHQAHQLTLPALGNRRHARPASRYARPTGRPNVAGHAHRENRKPHQECS
jgi:hypothetical protein